MLTIEDFNRQISYLIYRGQLVVNMNQPVLFSHDVLDVQHRTHARHHQHATGLQGSQS